MRRIFLAWAILLLVACSNNADNGSAHSEIADTSAAGTVAEEGTAGQVRTAFPALFQYLSGQDRSFSPDSFVAYGESRIEAHPAVAVDTAALRPFEKLLIYDRDSSLAIDLFSYNYMVVQRGGKASLEAAGPDTEVGLIDVAKGTRRRIFFAGPAITMLEARWNGGEVLLAGAESSETEKTKPLIWRLNLADSTVRVYRYPTEIRADLEGYRESQPARAPL